MIEDQLTTIWIGSIARIAPGAWQTLASIDSLPPSVRANSSQWAERFFTPLANPHLRPAEVHWSYTLATDDTPDAIRYLYRSASYDLDTVETRAYAVVRLRLPTLSSSLIEDAANEILLPPASGKAWKLHFLESLSEGSRFSSDLSSNPLDIASWEDLVEGGIRSGVPYFMRFKKHPQRHGYPGLGTWFDAGFSGRAV